MKVLLFSITVLSIASFSSSLAYAEQPLLDFYNNSHLVLVGKVISLSQVSTTTSNPSQSPNQTRYDIQVEQYYKNPQAAKIITVFGYAKGIYFGQDPTYNVGDRVFLYLDQENGHYQIQPHSFALDNDCDARSMIPIPTLPFESPPISSPAFGNIFDFQSASGIHSGTFGLGDKIRISFAAENYLPVIKYTTMNFTIKTDNNTTLVFNDTKQITIPACYSKVPILWDFIPKTPGTYFVSVNMSSSVSLGRQLVLFTEPPLGSSFDVRKNLTGGSLEKTPYQLYPLSPLKQVESGIAAKDVKCKEGLQLVIKSEDSTPACVTPFAVFHLYSIGWGYASGQFVTKTDLLDSKISGGKITEYQYDLQSTIIIIRIQTTNDGNLSITLPQVVINKAFWNAQDHIILMDGKQTDAHEDLTSKGLRLTIPFINGTQEIELIGNFRG